MALISSWGRLGSWQHQVDHPTDRQQLPDLLRCGKPGLAHGMGRSYGDVCLNPNGRLWHMNGLDRFIALDEDTGRLVCEPGVLLRDINRLALPRGWMLPVVPGTQCVTVGGAIANDVHGKNHHGYGCFGDHVRRLDLSRTDGKSITCGHDLRADWFSATVGGLGLTGVITEAEIQLRRMDGPWIDTEVIPYSGLDEFLGLADESCEEWEHTVSWFDCMSGGSMRGLFTRGKPLANSRRPAPAGNRTTLRFTPPFSLINPLTVKWFNLAYFHLNRLRNRRRKMHYEAFLCPLDTLLQWNRMYGAKGFYQYHFLVSRERGHETIQAMLDEFARSGEGSFLAVLKTFGERRPVGMLSFAQPGVTLALDFPDRGERTQQLLVRLDAILREAGGRIYPAKDARMPRDLFEAGYPRLSEFMSYRDPGITSALSRRLMGS